VKVKRRADRASLRCQSGRFEDEGQSRGVELFREGEAGTVAYLVKRGRVQIFVTRDEGELPLAVREPGEIVGEMAIIDHRPRSASARVLEDCELVVLTSAQLASRIENADPIPRMCLRS
jgi:diguanylate cyclase